MSANASRQGSEKRRAPLRQLVLLMIIRHERVTIPEVVSQFGVSYHAAAKNLHSLAANSLAKVVGSLPREGRRPLRKVYGPTALSREALKIPLETELGNVDVRAHGPVPRSIEGGAARRLAGSGVVAGPKLIRGYRW